MSRLARTLASVAGVGYAPAPGTAGSLIALPLGALLLLWSPLWLAGAALLVSGIGFWAILRAGGQNDPGWVVIDEVAGQWITLLGLSRPSWLGLATAFVLFRFLDIVKPGPIGWADRKSGAAGVMADDVLAGLLGALILLLVRMSWRGLPL